MIDGNENIAYILVVENLHDHKRTVLPILSHSPTPIEENLTTNRMDYVS